MDNIGWIAVWRKLRGHRFWQERRRFSKAEAWIDILMDAAFADHKMLLGNTLIPLKRGQAPISQRSKSKTWKWSRESVRSFMTLLVNLQMVGHEVVRGPNGGRTILTIRNYEEYQSVRLSDGNHKLGHDLGHELGHEPDHIITSITREQRTPVFDEGAFWGKFSPQDQDLIRQVIQAIHSTRKRGKVADSIIQAEMQWWAQQEPAKVIQGMQTYLQRGYAAQGKREPYLRGIVRNSDGAGPAQGPAPDDRRSPGAEAIRRAAMSMTREDCGDG